MNDEASNVVMSQTHHPRLILRRIGAVAAGLLVTVILSVGTDAVMHSTGVFPPHGQSMADSLFMFATAYRTVYSIAGCYITARLAPDRSMSHALVLGSVGLVVSIVGAVVTWDKPEFGPKWYPLVLIALAIPCAWIGGILYSRQVRAFTNS